MRLAPQAIPLKMLLHFDPDLRADIGRRLDLTVGRDMIPVPRDDDGPELWIYPPGREVFFPHHDVDSVNLVTMDSHGFCNPPRDNLDRDRLDIVTLGDSLTWCTGVAPEDTYSAYLFAQTGLAGSNLSRARTGLYEYLQFLKAFALEKQPRIVVLTVTGTNDLRDAVNYHEARRRGQEADAVASSRGAAGSWLIRNVYTVNILRTLWRQAPGWISRSASKVGIDFRYTLLHNGDGLPFNTDNADLDEVTHARLLRKGDIQLELFDRALEEFRRLSLQHHFVPLVTFIPSAYSAYWPNVRFAADELDELMPWFQGRHAEYLAEKTGELGLPYLDLTPALRAAAAEGDLARPLYFPVNPPPHARGE